jgi:hypothetical protein
VKRSAWIRFGAGKTGDRFLGIKKMAENDLLSTGGFKKRCP